MISPNRSETSVDKWLARVEKFGLPLVFLAGLLICLCIFAIWAKPHIDRAFTSHFHFLGVMEEQLQKMTESNIRNAESSARVENKVDRSHDILVDLQSTIKRAAVENEPPAAIVKQAESNPVSGVPVKPKTPGEGTP